MLRTRVAVCSQRLWSFLSSDVLITSKDSQDGVRHTGVEVLCTGLHPGDDSQMVHVFSDYSVDIMTEKLTFSGQCAYSV